MIVKFRHGAPQANAAIAGGRLGSRPPRLLDPRLNMYRLEVPAGQSAAQAAAALARTAGGGGSRPGQGGPLAVAGWQWSTWGGQLCHAGSAARQARRTQPAPMHQLVCPWPQQPPPARCLLRPAERPVLSRRRRAARGRRARLLQPRELTRCAVHAAPSNAGVEYAYVDDYIHIAGGVPSDSWQAEGGSGSGNPGASPGSGSSSQAAGRRLAAVQMGGRPLVPPPPPPSKRRPPPPPVPRKVVAPARFLPSDPYFRSQWGLVSGLGVWLGRLCRRPMRGSMQRDAAPPPAPACVPRRQHPRRCLEARCSG